MASSTETVAVLGLGIIGGTWARHYADAGVLAATWNRTAHPDAPAPVASPAEAARRASVLHVCVADPAAVRSVLEAALPELGPRHLVIQSSTIDPDSGAAFKALVEARGAAYVEAPFTGSKPAAEARKIVYYLGGTVAAKARAEGVLSLLSEVRIDCGGEAQAAGLKLAMNLNLAIMMNSLGESLAYARRSGIDDELYFAALKRNVGHSGLVTLKEQKLRARDYATQFSVKHMLKDVRLALASGAGAGLPLTDAARARLAAAAEAGFADDDFSSVARLLG